MSKYLNFINKYFFTGWPCYTFTHHVGMGWSLCTHVKSCSGHCLLGPSLSWTDGTLQYETLILRHAVLARFGHGWSYDLVCWPFYLRLPTCPKAWKPIFTASGLRIWISLSRWSQSGMEKFMIFWNFGFWTLGLAFKFFFGLWRFFWDLWCLTSPVVCKNYMSEQYFMPNSFCC